MAAESVGPGPRAERKAEYVRQMFGGIAHRYDLLNSILSFRRHHSWRRAAVSLAGVRPGDRALDVCTGTGDFALELRRAVGADGFVVGADFCEPMLRRGVDKVGSRAPDVALMLADALRLPYRSGVFDCVTVGFGIRNVADIPQALREMARVARPGGRVVCLEFCQPRSPLARPLVTFYETCILPLVGALLSRRDAYTYLPRSIQLFHSRDELGGLMREAGLTDIRIRDQNLGSVCIHVGTKA